MPPAITAERKRRGEARRRRYAKRVDRILRVELKQERRNIRNSLKIIRDLRTRVMEELRSAPPIEAAHQQEILRATDRAVTEMEGRMGLLMEGANEQSFNRGSDLGRKPLEGALGLELGAPDISPDILTAVQTTTGELITDLGKNVRKEISSEIQRAVLGEIRVDEAIANVDKKLRTGKSILRGRRARTDVAWQAERIVRTETARTFSIANEAQVRRAKKEVPDLEKQWFTNLDGRERLSHRRIHQQIRPVGRRFSNNLMKPLDPSGPPEEVVNCFLPGTLVRGHFIAGLKSRYSGPARELQTLGGDRLAVTPNHPILTSKGWRRAGDLQEGDHLLRYFGDNQRSCVRRVDDQNGPALIQDVFESLSSDGTIRRVRVSPSDLHGDAAFANRQVDIVRSDRPLTDSLESETSQTLDQYLLELTYLHRTSSVKSLGSSHTLLERLLPIAPSSTRFSRHSLQASRIISSHPAQPMRPPFGHRSYLDSSFDEMRSDCAVVNLESDFELEQTHSRLVGFDDLVQIRDFQFSGHVYDLQSPYGWIISNGYVASNCRCVLLMIRPDWSAPIPQERAAGVTA